MKEFVITWPRKEWEQDLYEYYRKTELNRKERLKTQREQYSLYNFYKKTNIFTNI